MNDSNSKKALEYLDAAGTVHALWHKIKRMEQLHALVSKHLDPPMQPYCKVISFLNNKLTIITANSSIASQLRFQSAELLQKLKQEPPLASIQTIYCKVQVHTQTNRSRRTSPPTRRVKPLSTQSAQIISEIANSISDPKLRAAMQRLAKNTKIS